MGNQLNTGTLESLKPGETLLHNARKVSNGKIQLEFAEVIQTSDRPVNVLGLLNKSDERFSTRARRAWVTAEPTDASEYFDINFGDDGTWYMGTTPSGKSAELMDLAILNPSINDFRCRLQVLETTEPTDWQSENVDTAAKRRGKEGDFITHKGDYIFSNTNVILSNSDEITHVFLDSDTATMKVESPSPAEQAEVAIPTDIDL
jgi:hypothetical protein|tara:strand:- start:2097 stop:2708 length:612 start_codon:yes stop_codon:yes gene_type:complete